MEEIIRKIKDKIEICKQVGDMFNLPTLPNNITVARNDVGSHGATLYHNDYHIVLPDGKTIDIDYRSKDKCKTFVPRPDRSYITVKCSDAVYNFSDAWDEDA